MKLTWWEVAALAFVIGVVAFCASHGFFAYIGIQWR